MLLDTDFLIDWQQELAGGRRPLGPSRFVRQHPDARLHISLISWMEFAEGYSEDQQEECRKFLSPFRLIIPDAAIAWRASRIHRQLRQEGRPVGDHDVWLAATALERGLSLATRNLRHYQRVPGIRLVTY